MVALSIKSSDTLRKPTKRKINVLPTLAQDATKARHVRAVDLCDSHAIDVPSMPLSRPFLPNMYIANAAIGAEASAMGSANMV